MRGTLEREGYLLLDRLPYSHFLSLFFQGHLSGKEARQHETLPVFPRNASGKDCDFLENRSASNIKRAFVPE